MCPFKSVLAGVCFSQMPVTLAADFAGVDNSEVSARRELTVHCSTYY